MMKITKVSVAKDFSRVPAGRFLSDGPVSGQVFRENLLVPFLRDSGCLEIDLDGTEGYGSSFLEESFGGLIREGFGLEELRLKLKLSSLEDPTLIDEILGYISDASQKARPRND